MYVDVEAGVVSLGPTGGFADAIVPAAQMVGQWVSDAAQAALSTQHSALSSQHSAHAFALHVVDVDACSLSAAVA